MSPIYKKVYEAQGHLEGESIRLFLESNDIPAETLQEAAGQVYGLTVGSLGKVTILVPEDRLEEAAALLEQMEEGELILPDDTASMESEDESEEDEDEN